MTAMIDVQVQHSTMSPVLPFDIIALIIDIVEEEKDTNLLKELALVSHSFFQICSKHLFATIELDDLGPDNFDRCSKNLKGFVKLLRSRPDVVKYFRKLTIDVHISPAHKAFYLWNASDLHLISSILPNLLKTIPHLKYLKIDAFGSYWNVLDSSLTSAFLYLMHLPTINHIELSYMVDFPLSSFTPSVNLRRLDILHLRRFDYADSSEIVVQSETMPKIREFRTSGSTLFATKLIRAKKRDGQPAFNFMDLKRLSTCLEDKWSQWNIQYLLQNAKSLESLYLSVERRQGFAGFHDILSPCARTLKVLDLTVSAHDRFPLPFAGLCKELEAMAGYVILEALSLEVLVSDSWPGPVDSIGFAFQEVDKVLVNPGWSALRQVSFKIRLTCWEDGSKGSKLYDALQSLPDKYLTGLSNLESVTFSFSAYAVKPY